ncbi:hypothetical protein BT67DRAFT_226304 [Trichocladium antarcticum]|uniref:Uncharacterized protein n=1 Tax=Trichocladium antarcticum TaxID=1450529 RepID=A0AAN6UC63_9PEZI|nr:hypothetical protein BT67DRAFT_226304 [Trichocladium antarcticum]
MHMSSTCRMLTSTGRCRCISTMLPNLGGQCHGKVCTQQTAQPSRRGRPIIYAASNPRAPSPPSLLHSRSEHETRPFLLQGTLPRWTTAVSKQRETMRRRAAHVCNPTGEAPPQFTWAVFSGPSGNNMARISSHTLSPSVGACVRRSSKTAKIPCPSSACGLPSRGGVTPNGDAV